MVAMTLFQQQQLSWTALCLAAFILLGSVAGAAPLGNVTEPYDFIIVGGGTAGVALAARLSSRFPLDRVLLLEAGIDAPNEPRINIPGRKGSTLGTKYDWNFTTVAQANASGRRITAARGKVLGGSSALNLMSWDRPSVADYDSWETLGNPTWNWETMLEAMLKVENFTGRGTETYGFNGVGFGGPIDTVINRNQPEQQDYWIPTVTQFGIPTNLESLNGNPLGVMYQPSNVDPETYVRTYSANSYLPLALDNLEVRTETLVNTVNFDDDLKAAGVTLASGEVLVAHKEVILSAGSIQSPGILERSGIGRSEILAPLGVSVRKELPVGENLQDHIRVQTSFQLRDNYTSLDRLRYDPAYAEEQLNLWASSQPSALDYTGSAYLFMNWAQVLGNASSSLISLATRAAGNSSNPVDAEKLKYLTTPLGDHVPQLEIIFSDGYTGVKGYPAANTTLFGKGFITLISALQHPLSRGSIHISSLDPGATPLINPNYLSYDYEVEALVQAIKYARRIANTFPLKQSWEAEYEPGDQVQTDEQIRKYIRDTVLTIYHPVATCGMLPEEKGGVVDAELRVYGTTGLRVVDASIMPILPPGHIQTGVYAIAERAADFITAAWAESED
ncbi:Long-chain-alcohol oxidase FAO3 [Sphaceloma murrayae]|uniref:Long-chain-alcohol oxidase FAO3 n=1 Tax=Sphaceloma murrayae TaxID=2082308 RepID=A0A2K1QLD9_9PEZI|nr:Long-chain-alcohol oxidase FAO3 [Sphaceloma murrayae]